MHKETNMPQILEEVKQALTPEFLSEAAIQFSETEVGIAKTISSLSPTILLGLLEKCGDSHLIDGLFESLRNFETTQTRQTGISALSREAPNNATVQFLGVLFGAKGPAITNAVAAFAGVKPSTVMGLLNYSGSLVMEIVHNKIKTEQLNPSSLVRYLLSERSNLMSVVPAGVGSLLGLYNVGNNEYSGGESTGLGKGWIWTLVLIIALGLGLVYFLKN